MPYFPGQNLAGANYNPYTMQSYGQYDAQAYDNSGYGDYNSFNTITPFGAWAKNNIFGIGSPPPGMSAGAYSERMGELSNRFTSYGIPAMIGTALSAMGSLAFMFPDVVQAGQAGYYAISGQANIAKSILGGTPHGALGAMSSVFGGVSQTLAAAFNAPFAAFFGTTAEAAGTALGGSLSSVADVFGGPGLGSRLSQGTLNIAKGMPLGIGTAFKGSSSFFGTMASGLAKAPVILGTGIASFMAIQAAMDTAVQGGMNALGGGIDAKQAEIADEFENLSSRVLSGPSGYKSKQFAKDIAKEIRDRSFASASDYGLMSKFGIGDTVAGRFTGGWAAIREMDIKTAQYSMMAESGLLSKSNSADEFIKKADAMYAAIEKLGQALGQTTSKAMETARVLKSQGLSDPTSIANAGGAIGTSSAMTGYSSNQVMALTGEATEAFRGTIYGADMGFNMANTVMRRIGMGASAIGDKAFDQTAYTMRGKDSMAVAAIKTNAAMFNSSEFKAIMIASMFEDTGNGFAFTGKINQGMIDKAQAGGDTFLTNEHYLATLSANFQELKPGMRREAERAINAYSSGLNESGMRGLLNIAAKMRGYKGENPVQDLYENTFRAQGLAPNEAYNMARMMSADTRTAENLFSYFDKKQRELDKYSESGNDRFKSMMSEVFGINTHKLLGSWTPVVETGAAIFTGASLGGLMGAPGAIAGGILGGISGLVSNQNYYQKLSRNWGFADDSMIGTPIAAVADTAAFAAKYGTAAYVAWDLGLKGAIVPTLAGMSAAYTGGKLGKYVGDQVRETSYKDWAGEIDAGVSTASSAALAVGSLKVASAALVSMGWNPIGWGTAIGAGIIAGGAALYSSYNRNVVNADPYQTEREALRQGMSVLMGGERLRNLSPAAYEALYASGQAQADKTASLIGSVGTPVSAATKGAIDAAMGKAASAWLAGSDDVFANMGDAGARAVLGDKFSLFEKNRDEALAYSDVSGASLAGIYLPTASMAAGAPGVLKQAIRSIAGKKKIGPDDPEMAILSNVKYAMQAMNPENRNLMERELTNLGIDNIQITDSVGNVAYKGMGFFADTVYSSFDSLKKGVGESITGANDILRKNGLLGGSRASVVTAENAALVFGMVNAAEAGDLDTVKKIAGGDEGLRLVGGAITSLAQKSPGDLSTFKQNISKGYYEAYKAMTVEGARSVIRGKAGVLGTSVAGTVSAYLDSVVLGNEMATDDRNRYLGLKQSGFVGVADPTVQTYLRTDSAVKDIIQGFQGKEGTTRSDINKAILGQESLSQANKILLVGTIGKGDKPLSGEELSNIGKTLSKQVLDSQMPSMSQLTIESGLANQNAIMTKLDTTLGELTAAIYFLKTGQSPPPAKDPEKRKKVEDSTDTKGYSGLR